MGIYILLIRVGVSYSLYIHLDTFSPIFVKAGNPKQTEQKHVENGISNIFFSYFIYYRFLLTILVFVLLFIIYNHHATTSLAKAEFMKSNLVT